MSVWTKRISIDHIEGVTREAIRRNVFSKNLPWALFHNLDMMSARIQKLQVCFPHQTIHAIAIKANPIIKLLKEAVRFGVGLEAASLEEIHIGLAAGCHPSRLVYDSPAKTMEEIKEAIRLGLYINADNLTELERISLALRRKKQTPIVGLRVNPHVGIGNIGITSVGHSESKFGVSIEENFDEILNAYKQWPWLRGVHVHVGSQGCDLNMLGNAVDKVVLLIEKIHTLLGNRQIQYFDIGGGLPGSYSDSEKPPDISTYSKKVKNSLRKLSGGSPTVITEFGRSIQVGCGWAISRVEYVKKTKKGKLAVVHFGADFLLRPIYQPHFWQHEYCVLDSQGKLKMGKRESCTIAGPLCFAGDLPAQDIQLPEVNEGDFIAVRDVGGYTLSLWSRHCSRRLPHVLGYRKRQGKVHFTTLRPPEKVEEVVRFWKGQK